VAIGTELEALDAFVERRAVAIREAAHEFFEAASVNDEFAEVENFAGGKFFPTRANGSGFANAAEEDADVVEREAHFTGKANEENTIEGFGGVAALSAGTRRRGKKTDFFVVADSGSVEAGLLSESADFHF